MTKQSDWKKRIRARMAKTDESYTTARRRLLEQRARRATVDIPGLVPGYPRFGGLQGETAVLRNVFEHAGLVAPHTGEPYTEAWINGLTGGIGCMYFVFEYSEHPPMLTITLRHFTNPDVFVDGAFVESGARITTQQTGSAKVARKALDEALAAGKAPIVSIDPVCLAWSGMPKEWRGLAMQYAAVVGHDATHVWVDDRAERPAKITWDDLATARASVRKEKHRLITVDGPPETVPDTETQVRAAAARTIRAFTESPFKSYASNFGFRALEKWQRLLTDTKDKKGWPTVFATPANVLRALGRVYECVRYEYTGPDGGRPFYAEFLREADAATGLDGLAEAADAFEASGACWRRIAEGAMSLDDDALRRWQEITDTRAAALRVDPASQAGVAAAQYAERMGLPDACAVDMDEARALFAHLAEIVGEIRDFETKGVEALRRVAG